MFKVVQLDEIFQQVIRRHDAEQQYRRIASGYRLEDLIKGILEHQIELAASLPLKGVANSKVNKLKETLAKVQAIPILLSEEKASYLFRNEGNGWINVNTGTGPQHNNNGTGGQFNAPIHGLQLAK